MRTFTNKFPRGYFQIIIYIKDKKDICFSEIKALTKYMRTTLVQFKWKLKIQTKLYYRFIRSAKLLLSFLLALLNKRTITVRGENYQQRRLDVHVKHMTHLKATCFTECKSC